MTSGVEVSRASELLAYDPYTGVFRWKKTTSNRAKVGARAGNITNGYREISIDGKSYRAHRLAWLLTYGVWPSALVDHINGDPGDNRICNLREASPKENAWNSRAHSDRRAGLKGTTYCPNRYHLPWQSRICVNGVTKPLGWYATSEEAHRAYRDAAQRIFGKFARAS